MTLAEAIERVGDSGAAQFSIERELAGGEVGATLVRDGDGNRWVAKWDFPAGEEALVHLRHAAWIAGKLRERGAKLPAYGLIEPIGGGVLVLQELMPGLSGDLIPDPVIAQLIAHNTLQTGMAPAGHGWHEYVHRSLQRGLARSTELLP
jgi:hypothetical protein